MEKILQYSLTKENNYSYTLKYVLTIRQQRQLIDNKELMSHQKTCLLPQVTKKHFFWYCFVSLQ